MKALVDLEFLNGLPVEREYLEEPDSFKTDSDEGSGNEAEGADAASSIREVPEEDFDASSGGIVRGEGTPKSSVTSLERTMVDGENGSLDQ
jgi:hypothetical protein